MLGRRQGKTRRTDDPMVAAAEAGERRRQGKQDIRRQEERVGRFQ